MALDKSGEMKGLFCIVFIFGLSFMGLHPLAGSTPWWQESVNVESKIGTSRSIQSIDVMYPISHSQRSLTFTDLRGRIDDDQSLELNMGLARRAIQQDPFDSAEEAVLGYYGFVDRLESEFDNSFWQGTGGIEYFTRDYSLRINGYFPENGREPTFVTSPVRSSGTQIFFENRQNFERALPGYDIELGRTKRFDWGNVYARGTYFRFHHTKAAEVEGSRFRAGVQLDGSHPDVYLPEESELTIGFEWQSDKVRDDQSFGVLRLSMPFGTNDDQTSDQTPRSTDSNSQQGKTTLPVSEPTDWQKDRLTQRIERDVDVVTGKNKNTERIDTDVAVVASTDRRLSSVALAKGNESGTGTLTDPGSLAQAIDQAGTDGTVFVVDSGGTISTPGVTVKEGQAIIGGNTRISLESPDGSVQTDFRLGGGQPTIADTTGSLEPMFTLKSPGGQLLENLDIVNRHTSYPAIKGRQDTGVKLKNLTIKSTVGITPINLQDQNDLTMTGIDVKESGDVGMLIRESDGVEIRDIQIRNTGNSGLNLSKSTDVSVRDLTMDNIDRHGVELDDNQNLTVSDFHLNDIGKNAFDYFMNVNLSNNTFNGTLENISDDVMDIDTYGGVNYSEVSGTINHDGSAGTLCDFESGLTIDDPTVDLQFNNTATDTTRTLGGPGCN